MSKIETDAVVREQSSLLELPSHKEEDRMSINHEYMLRIAYYSSSHYPQESITEEMFVETFGRAMGTHYFSKWQHLYYVKLYII